MNNHLNKIIMMNLAMLLIAINSIANPVDVKTAKEIGKKFILSNTAIYTKNTNLDLVYTFTDVNPTAAPYIYVFNIDDKGFVMVSADNLICPIIGYSTECIFSPTNISPELNYYISEFTQKIKYQRDNNIPASEKAIYQWNLVSITGNITDSKNSKAVEPLCKTKWDQGSPYNSLCPEDINSHAGGRVYAGCVACAMSQVMKYWNYPPAGDGNHTYTPSGYASQTANFGESNYNFAIMPLELSSSSTEEEIYEVAHLMYHCGVSVDMAYGPDGSGANSDNVPNALKNYFKYSDNLYIDYKMMYKDAQWNAKLKANLDNGHPLYYSGATQHDGHAFVCDGYDNSNYFHFNWGWSGSYDGYFMLDSTFMFYYGQDAIFDITPKYVDNPNVPDSFNLSTNEEYTSITLSWINPSTNAIGQHVNGNLQIVILKNGVAIDTLSSKTGVKMSYIDTNLSHFGNYEYTIFAIKDNLIGFPISKKIFFGSNCNITINMLDSMKDGWGDAMIRIESQDGTTLGEATLAYGLSTGNITLQLPPEILNFRWIPGEQSGRYDKECSFSIHDANNTLIYSRSFNNPLDSAIFMTINFDTDCNAININYYGIEDYSDNILLYPNPAKYEINLRSDKMIVKAELYDENGYLIDTYNVNSTSFNIKTAKYNHGIYLLKLYDKNDIAVTKKLIISH